MPFSTLSSFVAIVCGTLSLASPISEKRGFSFGGFNHGFGGFGSFGSFGGFHGSGNHVSLSGWGGFHSLDNFDDFYGGDNFCGFQSSSLVAVQKEELVCHSVSVEIIQQQLAIIREYVKKIITTQICEVETQTVVFSQFHSGMFGFGEDIRRVSGRHVGYDDTIASHIVNLHDEGGELISHDFGFHGGDIGRNFVSPSGFNWNDETSPLSVNSAFSASQSAASASGAGDALPATPSVPLPPPAAAAAPSSNSTTAATDDSSSTDAPAASNAPASDSSSDSPNPASD